MAPRSLPSRQPPPAVIAALALITLLAAQEARGWNPETQVLIAENALTVAPADLKRQIDKHIEQFRRGSLAPFDNGDASAHYKNGNGSGSLDRRILMETERAIQALRKHRPFRDVVYQLGVLAHYVADANNPLSTADSDPREGRYARDYLAYVEGAQERFAVAFYGEGRDLTGPDAIAPLLDRTLARGRQFYPAIGREYRRVGGPPGRLKFDDKSVAFAIGALSVSHAVSDVGAVLRYVWIEAGGADFRDLPVSEPPLIDDRR